MSAPITAVTRIAEADGFRPALRFAPREVLWHLTGLEDEDLPPLRRSRCLQQEALLSDLRAKRAWKIQRHRCAGILVLE
ncbi:hypothetical protein [Paracoccus sp. ME4]|uniref:hypothetical protein n=1 Tax=Paracoccus sp. ME4 TaxID=3138066 RepID=UPI00398B4767